MTPLTTEQLDKLRAEWGKITVINLASEEYKAIKRWLGKLPHSVLVQLKDANIKYLSGFAEQRLKKMEVAA